MAIHAMYSKVDERKRGRGRGRERERVKMDRRGEEASDREKSVGCVMIRDSKFTLPYIPYPSAMPDLACQIDRTKERWGHPVIVCFRSARCKQGQNNSDLRDI